MPLNRTKPYELNIGIDNILDQLAVLTASINALSKENVKVNLKLDAVIKRNKTLQSVLDSSSNSPDAIIEEIETIEEDIKLPETIIPVQVDNNHLYFKSLEAKKEEVVPLIGGVKQGTQFMLFYRETCGSCEVTLRDMRAFMTKEQLESKSLMVIPRDHAYAIQLIQKYSIKAYPTLVVVKDSKSANQYEGSNIVPFLKTVFNQ